MIQDPLEIVAVSSIDSSSFDPFNTENDDDKFDENMLDDTNDDGLFNAANDENGLFPNDYDGEEMDSFNGANPTEYESKRPDTMRKSQLEADYDLIRMGGIRQKINKPKVEQVEIDTLTCGDCGKKLAQKYQLMRHKLTHLVIKPYKCTICDRTFSRREHLKHHLLTHRKIPHKMNNPRPIEQNRNITITPNNLRNASTLNAINTPNSQVALRNRLLDNFKSFAAKIQNECANGENIDFYEQCFDFVGHLILSNLNLIDKETFFLQDNQIKPEKQEEPLARPYQSESLLSASNSSHMINMYGCNVCNLSFQTPRQLFLHSKTHTNRIKVDDVDRLAGEGHIFKCDLCPAIFGRLDHKKRHMLIHRNDYSQFECEICQKKLTRSDHLITHFKNCHPDVKPYRCKYSCGQRFDTYKEKLAHSRWCLTGGKPEKTEENDDMIGIDERDNQEIDPMMDVLFGDELPANDAQNSIPEDFHSHFIKAEVPDDSYLEY